MRLFSWVIWTLLMAAPAIAQAPQEAASEPEVQGGSLLEAFDPGRALARPARNFGTLQILWQRRRQALEVEDAERADELFAETAEALRDSGIGRLDSFAHSLIREARAAWQTRHFDRAQVLLEQARTLAPTLPDCDLAEAELALAKGVGGLPKWLRGRINAFIASFSDVERRMLLLSDAILTCIVLIVGVAMVFLLAQVLRHGLSIFYDLGSVFPQVWRSALLLAMLFIGLVPLYYGFGPFLLFFPLVVLLWVYQNRTERVISVVLTVLLGTAPWALRVSDRLSDAGTGLTQALYHLGVNAGDNRAANVVAAAVEADETDWPSRAVLGLAYKRRGKLEDARQLLEEAMALAPPGSEEFGAIENNLGNVYFATGRLRAAEAHYQAAQALLPESAAPVFNQHRLYQRTGQLEQAGAAIQRATGIDGDRVSHWNEDADLSLNRYVVDVELPKSVYTKRVTDSLLKPTPISARLWLVLAGPVSEMIAPLAAFVTLIIVGVMRRFRDRFQITRPCVQCVHPARVRLGEKQRRAGALCEDCNDIFVRNVPVDRRTRFEKEAAVARHRTLQRWLLRAVGVLLPGLASLFRGLPVRGILMLGLALSLVLRLLWPHGVLVTPAPSSVATASQTLLAVLLGVVWLYGAYDGYRLSEERG